MTEHEWLANNNPGRMIHHLTDKANERKLRLFAVACCRRIWPLLTDERSRRAVEAAERYADGLITADELAAARVAAEDACAVWAAATDAEAVWAVRAAKAASTTAWLAAWDATAAAIRDAEKASLAALLRDICGNPWQPLPSLRDTSWLRWHDGLIRTIAQQMYDSRDFSTMPILVHALEDAGCTNEEILQHCRSGSPHVRGCWVVDLILGKE